MISAIGADFDLLDRTITRPGIAVHRLLAGRDYLIRNGRHNHRLDRHFAHGANPLGVFRDEGVELAVIVAGESMIDHIESNDPFRRCNSAPSWNEQPYRPAIRAWQIGA